MSASAPSSTSAKKATTKPRFKSTTAKAVKPASIKKASGAGLPPYRDLIKEAIVAHPDDARSGVSRAQIKKFVEEKYKIEVTTAVNNHINSAIARGAEKGDFVLPKGLNGKVKLNKAKPAAKENVAPSSTSKGKEVLKPSKSAPKGSDTKEKSTETTKKSATSQENKPTSRKTAVKTKTTTTKKASAAKPSTSAKATKVKVAAKAAAKKTSTRAKTTSKDPKPASTKVASSKKA